MPLARMCEIAECSHLNLSESTIERTTEDVGNIVNLGHVNVCIPEQRSATAFYVSGLGLTRDPYMVTGITNMWVNVGMSQFHLPTAEPQVVRGTTGLVIPDREALLEDIGYGNRLPMLVARQLVDLPDSPAAEEALRLHAWPGNVRELRNVVERAAIARAKALFGAAGQQALANGHAKGKLITKENAVKGAGIPFHPGAERFYKEAGLIK